MNKRVILWTNAITNVVDKESTEIGGINVQMYFWSQAFIKRGWKAYSFYSGEKKKCYEKSDVHFIKDAPANMFSALYYSFFSLYICLKIRPDLVITRGGTNRNLAFISACCHICGIKQVHFVASDKELDLHFGTVPDKINMRLFKYGLRKCKNIVVQNDFQENLFRPMCVKSNILQIRNIWGDSDNFDSDNRNGFVLWVANIKSLKRPEWIYRLAAKMPSVQFVMIGGNKDNNLFSDGEECASKLTNLRFLGHLHFATVNEYFGKAKLFVCSSEYEGFPNTFLQAWANGVPVVSTVDPSEVITKYSLGSIINTEEELQKAIENFVSDDAYYNVCKDSINKYFYDNHSSDMQLGKLLHFLNFE